MFFLAHCQRIPCVYFEPNHNFEFISLFSRTLCDFAEQVDGDFFVRTRQWKGRDARRGVSHSHI
jgi:hypothetical protein